MMIYSHARSQIVINGRTITGVDPSADSYSLAPVGDAGAFTGAFGQNIWVASGETKENLTLKLLQNHPDNGFLQKLFDDQRQNPSMDNVIQHKYNDPINGDEIVATGGRIMNGGTYARGNAANANTWVIQFPKVIKKFKDE